MGNAIGFAREREGGRQNLKHIIRTPKEFKCLRNAENFAGGPLVVTMIIEFFDTPSPNRGRRESQ